MSKYEQVKKELEASPKTWLVTGAAGFIGSNLVEALLLLNQRVIGLDNFATGHQHNLDEVMAEVSKNQWKKFNFIEGDICDYKTCERALEGVDHVLHQAALGSVPRSIADPLSSNMANITGFLNMLQASKEFNVKSFTYAASSSTYGDHPALPKTEKNIGNPLSPYAVTKLVNELYAGVYAETYGFQTIGLRYFNVFGKRQDKNGPYAAVIPRWASALINGEKVYINGDGETSRDFCFIDNAVQANLLAAVSSLEVRNEVYNVALGDRTTLNQLYLYIKETLGSLGVVTSDKPIYKDFRPGDVRYSEADISKAKNKLGYQPTHIINDGIETAMHWYLKSNK